MRCFFDDRVCTCDLDDVAHGDCPRDPFRHGDGDDENLRYLNELGGMDETDDVHW